MENTERTKSKAGRKPLPPDQKLIQVQVRMPRDLFEGIHDKSEQAGMGFSEWVRWVLEAFIKDKFDTRKLGAPMGTPITFNRTFDRPLAFTGELLATAEPDMSEIAGRQYTGHLARTDGGTYVAHVAYLTDWKKVETNKEYARSGDLETITAWLREFDYLDPVVGYPEGVNDYARKTKILNNQLRTAWMELVTTLLGELPPETVE